MSYARTPARPPRGRRVTALATVVAMASGLLSATPTVAVAQPAGTEPPRVRPAAGVWSADQWTSTSGNTVSDVAKMIGATSPAASGLDGRGVGIALIDTGVVPAQGLPAAQVVNGPDLSLESQSSKLRYLDTYGHGTHLAGIIVGNDSSTGLRGIAPGAKLTSIKVGVANGAVDVSQVIAALDWVVEHRNDDPADPIKVICLAYGTDAAPNMSNDPLLHALENATDAGILVVVAAGNAGTSLGRVNSPSMDPMSLTVGSSESRGTTTLTDDRISTFTSVDPDAPIDLVAPGESIVSLRNPGSYIDVNYPGARVGSTLFRGSGSSQAAAVVAGAAALLLQKYPTAPPHRTRYWLRKAATPLTGTNAGRAYGSLNLAAALAMSPPTVGITYGMSTGRGLLEFSRGSTHLVDSSSVLVGEKHLFGPFNAYTWATASETRTAWQGGVWMGHRMAGDDWTGTSWASKTWGAATWSGTNWSSRSWSDSNWNGRYWTGRYWSSTNWSGRYWSGSTWEAKNWSTAGWH